ncbi:MAG: UDP-N-acetylmuramoyl-tripeptide--D-alanyl-D-alanine ligase [Lachnospiraceae bacterium]|nr:UDP-N-acetylmuramoyl-tripeptide--D-alanyl-D-alanine ligase [Lachnospiraceae bacterium]
MEKITLDDIVKATGGKLLGGSGSTEIDYVSIDSRDIRENTLFVPIVGENVDAHKFIPDVFEKGAAASFTAQEDVADAEHALILVDDTGRALIRLAAWYRRLFPIPVVGITGSVGKTSTKEFVAEALTPGYKVMRTKGNFNSQIGVPLTVFNIEKGHDIAVVEMGISDFGEMDDLVDVAAPECAAVTNIGVAHILNFKELKNTLSEKLRITRDFGPENTVFLNGNDPLLKDAVPNGNVKYYGIGEEERFDVFATDLSIKNGQQSYTFNMRTDEGIRSVPVTLKLFGEHYVLDSMTGIAIAVKYGIPMEAAAKAVSGYAGLPGRQNIVKLGNDITVIDDTYNASPDSIKSGIRALKSLEIKGRRIAVLADVLELGDGSYDLHYEVGKWIAEHPVDMVFATGNETKALCEALAGSTVPAAHNDTNNDTFNAVVDYLQDGDALLVKGSHGMHQEEIVNKLKERFGTGNV